MSPEFRRLGVPGPGAVPRAAPGGVLL